MKVIRFFQVIYYKIRFLFLPKAAKERLKAMRNYMHETARRQEQQIVDEVIKEIQQGALENGKIIDNENGKKRP